MNFQPQEALRKDNSRKTEMKGSKEISNPAGAFIFPPFENPTFSFYASEG